MDIVKALDTNLTEYQSIPFWSWNDDLQEPELRRQIRAMKSAGIGGFFMHARGGLTTPYLGKKWMDLTGACIDEARKQGMDAWCYDENGWPSGFAGMKLLEDEANWEHYITCETLDHFDDTALGVYALDGGRIRRVYGAEDGLTAYVTVYEKKNSSVVDILNPEIVRKFLDETHEKYYTRFGEDFGAVMKGFFTDEPQFFRWDTAYTPCILPLYKGTYGEDLLDELGCLFVDAENSKRFRFRYWSLMNRLYTDSFAKQIYEWCEAHNCQLTGHSIEESSLFGQMMCCAGIMPFYEYEHKPGVDWLGRRIHTEATPRQVSSVAQQLGKKHVLTETFACAGWDVTPRELKRIAEWQYVNGVNQMCQHLYPYSIRGQRKRDYPAFYSEHNTWTKGEDFRRFNDYFTALGYMLSESRELADVAVIHPIHSAYFTFKRGDEHSCDALNARFTELIETLGRMGIGHHYVDETLLKVHGSVDGEALVMGRCRYKYVVIPDMEGLDASTARLLKAFMENGGKLYLQGQTPHLCDGEEADLSFLKANTALEDMLSPVCSIDRRDTDIRFTYRFADFGDFAYAVNLSETESYDVTFRLSAKGAARFDAEERVIKPVYFVPGDAGCAVPMTLRPGQSVILMADDDAVSAPAPKRDEAVRVLDLNGFVLRSRDDNTLTLDTVALSFDGENYEPFIDVMAASDRILRRRKNGVVYLKYAFDVQNLPVSLRIEREDMRADAAWLNGHRIAFDAPGTFDPAFISAVVEPHGEALRPGRNELVLRINYHQPQLVYDVFNGVYYEHSDGTESLINCLSYETDIEAVYLRGDFSVKTQRLESGPRGTIIVRDGFRLDESMESASPDRLAEAGFPFFGGKMTFVSTFEATGRETKLRLKGRYMLAKIRLGGEERTLMFDDECDITGLVKPGSNKMELTLYSGMRNVFGPHHFRPAPEPMAVSPDLFSGYGRWKEDGTSDMFTPAYQFTFFGLNGIEISMDN